MTSLLTPAKMGNLRTMARRALSRAAGPMAEVGVYRGGSARAMLEEMDALGQRRTMHLFDTFEGLPVPGLLDAPGRCCEGQWAAPLQDVMELLGAWFHCTKYHVGLFPETASGLGGFFSVVHVDVDLEESVRACCRWFAPRMSRGGIIIFDDYGSRDWQGVKLAVDAYFKTKVEPIAGCHQAVVHF